MNEVILLVDDEELVRKLLDAYLESAGYRVIQARSSAEAREKALGCETIDVVIADLGLPDGGGVALVHDLQRTRPPLRALWMSGNSDACVPGRFIAKPFGLTELLEAVQLVLDDDFAATTVAA
jgi:DNA-binding response OmpR family regulator